MLVSARDLESLTIGATDGDIGSVYDFYFDDESWTVRYLVVDTGHWLPGRRVLVSPMSVREPSWSEQRLAVRLTREQVEHSPDIDAGGPITRRHESELVRHYGLDPYWFGPYRWGAMPYPFGPVPLAGEVGAGSGVTPEARRALEREGLANVGAEHVEGRHLGEERGDRHLRSAREVMGYAIQATDGEIGHVEDFLVDDRTWAIRYVVVDTRNWLPGKHVLVAPEWISLVSWPDSKVYVSMSRERIREAPEYDASRPPERDEERRLYAHYDRAGYWDAEPPDDRAA